MLKLMTHSDPSPLRVLSLVLSLSTLAACTSPAKQIGQLDGESSESGDSDESDESGEPDEEAAANCQAGIDYVQSLFAEPDGHCGIVVRSTYLTGEILGWQLICSDEATELTLEQAKALTQFDNGPEQDISLNPEEHHVLYASPVDSGSLAFVSKRSGLLFDGEILALGLGQLYTPTEFEDPSLLGEGCSEGSQPETAVEVWPYDWTPDAQNNQISPTMELTLDQLWDTGLFYASVGGPVNLLAYPRTVEAFDPNNAEVVTIIDAK